MAEGSNEEAMSELTVEEEPPAKGRRFAIELRRGPRIDLTLNSGLW